MKKKLFYGFAVLGIAVVVAFNMNLSSNGSGLSDISLANVEALARDEGGGNCDGCADIGWGTHQILKCDCSYTGWFSSCDRWGCQ